jgi:hypothetical protein
MKAVADIKINLDHIQEGLVLQISENQEKTLFDASEDASDNNEAPYQLVEGCSYDFKFNSEYFAFDDSDKRIIKVHKQIPNAGTITPKIYVGTLSLPLISLSDRKERTQIQLEVQSAKSGYRQDYRDMLEFITEKTTELLMQADSPASHYFEIDYSKDNQTLYQKFSFLKSIIQTDEFAEAINRIVTAPVTKWTIREENKDIRQERRFSGSVLKQFGSSANRTPLAKDHPLRKNGLTSLPQRINSFRKDDSVDTPENRFIKHVLEVFLKFGNDIYLAAKKHKKTRLLNESVLLIRELESHLHHRIFKQISRPDLLKLNSPVLQRKEGYREVLKTWLMFDLAAQLIWKGGEDVYSAGKKNVATLYEYWLFFQLLELFKTMFDIDPKDLSKLIVKTKGELNLSLKEGKQTALSGVYSLGTRDLNIRFNYNRVFSGEKKYPESGSWTTTLRPDYTLSIWPAGIEDDEAEKEELIVHIHFDAKYKVSDFLNYFRSRPDDELDTEKDENKEGVFKNADLLKMHAYKDAIRRTGGAYVLYPGDKTDYSSKGFHEIIPGLGAFAIKPSKNETGISELKDFIHKIIDHFINRASQREKLAFRTYDIFKNKPLEELKEPLPEPFHTNRGLIPDETFVLVGYIKSKEHYNWIVKQRKYNFRIGSDKGSLVLDKEMVSSRYLLLHKKGDKNSGELWRIISPGPKVYSKEDLKKTQYPEPNNPNYLVIEIDPVIEKEFKNIKFNFKKLLHYESGRASAIPFSASLSELMRNKDKD